MEVRGRETNRLASSCLSTQTSRSSTTLYRMAPVDPGSQIYWSKNPSYTTSLLSSISLLPSPDSRQLLFSSSKSKSTQWKNTKQSTLETVTSRVFSANGDQQRERKQRDSTMRRITQLGKEYNDSLGQLKQDPYNVNKTLGTL